MRRRVILFLFSCGVLSLLGEVQGAERREPRRFQRSTFAEYIVRPKSISNPNPRLVYRGYTSQGFPPPAMFYYGYPHSGDGTYGPGF